MQDDRTSVITLARSASHQISRVWEQPGGIARLSVDEVAERAARSEADASHVRVSTDIEQPLLVQAHEINHETEPPDTGR